MKEKDLEKLLGDLANKKISPDDVLKQLKHGPFDLHDSDFFTPDHHRSLRTGFSEVVYSESKKTRHLLKIAENFSKKEQPALFTRLKKKQYKELLKNFPEARKNKTARTIILNPPSARNSADNEPFVCIVCAGTSDLAVLEEAAETCVAMGVAYEKIVDVGVAGLHRVLNKLEILQQASAIIVVAGMEGALPSVVGGLVQCPLFAVPTSVGYGASFKGVSALLGMLNSCAPGITVVNIDNGFSAAFAACQVIRQLKKIMA
jgi:pyridinium-3,5-biscarboxylic acid mononucleotide synthase